MNELIQIEQMAQQLTEQTIEILNDNYPLDSRYFLPTKAKELVDANDKKIALLADKYLDLYNKLSIEEQKNYNYKNIQGNYYQQTHQSKGLIKAYESSDEYELHEAFSRATKFGMEALESLNAGEQKKDTELVSKSKMILTKCIEILNVHYWGKSRIEYLKRYDTRLRTGRTIEEDIEEYKQLIESARILSVEYATTILNGITDLEKKKFVIKFEDIFQRETLLTEFVPKDKLKDIYQNLHWMKVDAERTPELVIENSVQEERKLK